MIKSVLLLFGIRGFLALYSLIVFTIGISNFSLEVYGSIVVVVSIFALCTRIISFGFDYKIRDLIKDHNISFAEFLSAKFLLASAASICILIIYFIFGYPEYLELIILSFFVYSFDTMPYFQAKDRYQKPVFLVVIFLVIGLIYLWIEIQANSLTKIKFLAACILVPSSGWMLVSIRELFEEWLKPNISKCRIIIKEGFEMFTVAQLPGLYVNVIPIIVGFQSELFVAMYSIVLRISNFGKSFGVVVNQVFFYKKSIGRSILNVLISVLGSVVIATVCSIVIFYFFNQKLYGSFESLSELIMLVALFSFVGATSNFLIIKVFFENRLYTQYRNKAFFLIIIPVSVFGFFRLPPELVFLLHIAIETSLISYCLYNVTPRKLNL